MILDSFKLFYVGYFLAEGPGSLYKKYDQGPYLLSIILISDHLEPFIHPDTNLNPGLKFAIKLPLE